jgi:molecular chaperone GrpE
MSDPATPGIAGEAAADGADALLTSEQIESILGDFRDWLRENVGTATAAESPSEPVDLYTLVAQFTALRQEVNLQTRAVRQQQEQTAATVQQYGQSLELLEASLHRQADSSNQSELDSMRPLLNALVEATDAQLLAAKEMARLVDAIRNAESAASQRTSNSEEPLRTTLLGRLLGLGRIVEAQSSLLTGLEARLAGQFAASLPTGSEGERVRAMVEAASAGLAMGLQRLDRAMRQQGLEPIAVDGQRFDPEEMEAVEVVKGCNRPAGEVIEEVRRGYRLNGRVFRFAQVRVAK